MGLLGYTVCKGNSFAMKRKAVTGVFAKGGILRCKRASFGLRFAAFCRLKGHLLQTPWQSSSWPIGLISPICPIQLNGRNRPDKPDKAAA
jgi:hypothetical protein